MTYTEIIILIIEIIGTAAFASSGALVGIKKNMDIFGVNVLGITTAVGGGMIRDIVLGLTPPLMFRNPLYVLLSIVVSSMMFVVVYVNRKVLTGPFIGRYERVMVLLDAVGLGSFTVLGINTALTRTGVQSGMLLVFVGLITGIGGGMLRDIMAGMTPFVFIKHVYALASIIGAIICIILQRWSNDGAAFIIGAAAVVVIRILAAHYRWNLPRIQSE